MKQKIKVAIVDDQALFRQGLIALLSEFEEFEISLQAENGKDLIKQLKAEILPDIILLDLDMPEMDGEETTKFLAKSFPQIKIIILTMHNDKSFAKHLIAIGAHGFLAKNCNVDKIAKAIYSVTETGYHFNDIVSQEIVEDLLLNGSIDPVFRKTSLSEREIEILGLISKQYTCKEIADKLFLSIRTVEGHKDKLIKKIGAKNVAGLVVFAVKHNLHKWNTNQRIFPMEF